MREKNRLLTIVAGLLIAAVLIIGAIVFYREHLGLEREVEVKSQTLAEAIASSSAASLSDGDYTSIERLAKRLSEDPDIAYIAVVDLARKRWVAHTEYPKRLLFEKRLIGPEEKPLLGAKEVIQNPIVFEGKTIGLVLVSASGERVRRGTARAGAIIALVCLVWIGAILVGAASYSRARTLEREKDRLEAMQAERQRIYDDAHDRIYNKLRGIGLEAQATLLQNPSQMRLFLSKIDLSLRQVVAELQEIIRPMGETFPDERGEAEAAARAFAEDLARTCEEFATSYGLTIKFRTLGEAANLTPPHFRIKLLDILRILLDNVATHAKAKKVEVVFAPDNPHHPRFINLSVSDDGVGWEGLEIEKLPQSCRGLRNMQRKVREMGGEYKIATGKRRGTTVLVKVPLKGEG
jgi:signal transduction histidine kinase